MAKFRYHRGGLAESLATQVTVNNKVELIEELNANHFNWTSDEKVGLDDIKIKPYGYDERIQENTHIVYKEGYGVIGVVSEMLK